MRLRLVIGLAILGITLLLFVISRVVHHYNPVVSPTTAVVNTTDRIEVKVIPAVKNSTDYKLVVGAKPSFDPQQTFSPPTNSVAITNEEQLRILVLQAQSRVSTNRNSQ